VLNLLNIERTYNLPKSLEVSTIDRILQDEGRKVNLRDLPSFYYCSTSLANSMKKNLEQNCQRTELLNQVLSYGKFKDQETELYHQIKVQIGDSLQADKCIRGISSNFSKFESLDTLEVIQAMLILPFEHKLMQAIHNLETKTAYLGEL